MSQVADIAPRGMGRAADTSRRKASADVGTMTEAELADEHRGQGFAKRRAAERLAAVEAELDRRKLTRAVGALGVVERKSNDGLIDLKRLRAERPEILREYATPGSDRYWSSRTLSEAERA